MIFYLLALLISPLDAFVTAKLNGQLGNNLFQVATASALAWDHQDTAYFSDFEKLSLSYRHVFFRCDTKKPTKGVSKVWFEPSLAYHPIPYHPNMKIYGYFQSEKYFLHQREGILKLFAPQPKDLKYMQEKYDWLIAHPKTVGVQIRYFLKDDPEGKIYPQYGRDYLEKALALFPEDSLFVVSSDRIDFARSQMPNHLPHVIYLENEPDYIDFYLLSLCKDNIITNSTFGWWSAWLNEHPEKRVVHPKHWIHGLPYDDICPESWIKIEAECL